MDFAPLYADPRFVPTELHGDFAKVTLVRILGPDPPAAYSILNDPDTGIFAPDHRKSGCRPQDQRMAKLSWLKRQRIEAFYYVSHAPFMFASASPRDLGHVRVLLEREGIPPNRLEPFG